MSFFSFETFIFPRIVRIVYLLGLVLIGLAMIVGAIAGLWAIGSDFATGAAALVAAIVGGIIGAIVWRLVVELWLVIFSINDHLKALRDRGRLD